jgi:hypothetical protein
MLWKIEKNRQGFNDRRYSGVEFKDSEQFLTHSPWNQRIGIFFVEENRLLEAVEIGSAIRTMSQMTLNLVAGARSKFRVEIKLEVTCNLTTRGSMSMTLMHRFSGPSNEERDRTPQLRPAINPIRSSSIPVLP